MTNRAAEAILQPHRPQQSDTSSRKSDKGDGQQRHHGKHTDRSAGRNSHHGGRRQPAALRGRHRGPEDQRGPHDGSDKAEETQHETLDARRTSRRAQRRFVPVREQRQRVDFIPPSLAINPAIIISPVRTRPTKTSLRTPTRRSRGMISSKSTRQSKLLS